VYKIFAKLDNIFCEKLQFQHFCTSFVKFIPTFASNTLLMDSIQAFHQIISTPKNIVLTTHANPDADAFGSSLGYAAYLKQFGHTVHVISGTSYPNNLAWMDGAAEILIYENKPALCASILQKSDVLVCLDFNVYTRTADFANEIKDYKGIKVIIDHHLNPDTDYFNFGISMPDKSSTCEMVFDIIANNQHLDKITQAMATNLYAGVMTDTGQFKYSGTTADTHRMVAVLLEKGVNPNDVCVNIYDTYKVNRLKLIGHVFNNNLKIYQNYNAALVYVSEQDALDFDVQQGDTEGIVNYPLSINDIVFSTFMHQKKNEVKMSFRSKGSFDVNKFARTYFNGGGHLNASGGKGLATIDETIIAFETALQDYFKTLQQSNN
jgi:bifunctional oligoribonuclease and PAP phosphatase NrnA